MAFCPSSLSKSVFCRSVHSHSCDPRTTFRSPAYAQSLSPSPSSSSPLHCSEKSPSILLGVGNVCVDVHVPITSYPVQAGVHQVSAAPRLSLGGIFNALLAHKRLGGVSLVAGNLSSSSQSASAQALHSYIFAAANQHGIDIAALDERSSPTGIQLCTTLVDPRGTHTFIASNETLLRDMNNKDSEELHKPVLASDVQGALEQATDILIDGYALCTKADRALCHAVLDHLRSNQRLQKNSHREQKRLWLDVQRGGCDLHLSNDDLFAKLRASAYCITCNEAEAKVLSNASTEISPMHSAKVLLRESAIASMSIVKLGKKGCVLASHDVDGIEVLQIPACNLPGPYRDSVGAGDVFLGTFIAAVGTLKFNARDAAIFANAMAAAACTRSGAGEEGVPDTDDALKALQGTFGMHAREVEKRILEVINVGPK